MKTFSSIYPFTNRLELRRATCITSGAEGGEGVGEKMHPFQEQINTMVERAKSGVNMLYKYCPVRTAEKILTDRSVFLSPPKFFNDPYEMQCRVIWPDSDDELQRSIDKMHSHLPKNERHELYLDALRHKRNSGNDLPTSTRDLLRDKAGVSCFSEVRDNILMWSRYADEHRGVCIGFHLRTFIYSLQHYIPDGAHSQCIPCKVHYKDNDDLPTLKATEVDIENVIFTKAGDWEYEREWRIFALNAARKKQKFSESTFVEVIFGVDIPQCAELRLRGIIDGLEYSRPKILKAEMHQEKYKMEIVDYDGVRC